MRLTAFKRSTTPTVEGEVTYVSADMLTDPRNGETYFPSRITPSKQSLLQWHKQVTITPGMPAEVMIATGERRAFEYSPSGRSRSVRRTPFATAIRPTAPIVAIALPSRHGPISVGEACSGCTFVSSPSGDALVMAARPCLDAAASPN